MTASMKTCRFAWAVVGVLALIAPASLMAAAAAKITDAKQESLLYDAVKLVNGTWKLVKRINADGSQHAQPLRGITTLNLQVLRSQLVGTRAIGTIQAEESGIFDSRFGDCVPKEVADKPYVAESYGTWVMSVDSDDGSEAFLTVKQNTFLKATYPPYKDGLTGSVEAKYRVFKLYPQEGPSSPSAFELIKPIRHSEALTLKGDPISPAALERSCCNCSAISISGDQMWVKWGNGGQDYWKKDPAK